MDKTKFAVFGTIGALVLYAIYRHYQGSTNGTADQLPAQSNMQYYSLPPTASASDGIGTTYVHPGAVSETITRQNGKQVLYTGQPLTYPTV